MAKDEEKAEEPAKKGGKLKLILIIVPVLLLVGGAAYWFLLKPSDAAATTALPEPVAGAVVQLDPITVNLDGGHFLKLGMALQPTKAGAAEVTGAKALDLAIGQFSNMTVDDLSSTKGRAEAKAELVARVKLAYLPEGTSIKAAISADPKKEAKTTEAKHGEDSESESEQTASSLSGAEAIKLAGELKVQPVVYDVFLTEFVMQ